jgi:ABC-2 type transport system permease protein
MSNPIFTIGIKELKSSLTVTRVLVPALIIGTSIMPQLRMVMNGGDKADLYATLIISHLFPIIITYQVGTNIFLNEIRWKTIKSLLVTPVSDIEILLGKSLACIFTGITCEALLALLVLRVTTIPLDSSAYVILLGIGPSTVLYATFLIVAASAKFPVSESYGKSSFITMGGVMTLLGGMILSQEIYGSIGIIFHVIMLIIVASLALFTLITSVKLFNRERLVSM